LKQAKNESNCSRLIQRQRANQNEFNLLDKTKGAWSGGEEKEGGRGGGERIRGLIPWNQPCCLFKTNAGGGGGGKFIQS